MGLLPHQERPDRARTLPPVGAGLLGPAGSGAALRAGGLAGERLDGGVPGQAAFQQLRASPQREVRRVPPVHLQVEAAAPAVGDQPGLGGWGGAGAVDRREVLRQDDPPLQLGGALVAAAGQVHRPARAPEPGPVPCRGSGDLLMTGRFRLRVARQEGERQLGDRLVEGDQELVEADRDQLASGSPHAHLVRGAVEPPLDRAAAGACEQAGGVLPRPGPVGRVPPRLGPVRERQPHPRLHQRGRLQPHADHVPIGMAGGDDMERRAAQQVAAGQRAGPQVEALAGAAHVLGGEGRSGGRGQPDPAEVEPVRVGAQPRLGGRGGVLAVAAQVAAHVHVRDRPPGRLVRACRVGQPVRAGHAVPAPRRHGGQQRPRRRTRAVLDRVGAGERLQPGEVRREAELPVAHRQR